MMEIPDLFITCFSVTAQAMAALPDGLIAGNPSRRNGTPADVAGAALFLSSRAGAYVNGATITLDGGHLVSMPSSKL
jgi:NAD(P)-dependent dehydrogenase (short-subunit alcohol dehydrogenase family)